MIQMSKNLLEVHSRLRLLKRERAFKVISFRAERTWRFRQEKGVNLMRIIIFFRKHSLPS